MPALTPPRIEPPALAAALAAAEAADAAAAAALLPMPVQLALGLHPHPHAAHHPLGGAGGAPAAEGGGEFDDLPDLLGADEEGAGEEERLDGARADKLVHERM